MQWKEELEPLKYNFEVIPVGQVTVFSPSWLQNGEFILPEEDVFYKDANFNQKSGLVNFIGSNIFHF